jgi:DNA-binding transcriptional MerR regulator
VEPMTAPTMQEGTVLTVGQVAERFGVTVRTLHHYDEIGLLTPGGRSRTGYRLYTDDDVVRLQHVVVYRRLGFPLEQIAVILDGETGTALVDHLQRQRAAVMSRLEEMTDLVTAIDRALEQQMTGVNLTKQEQRELFGDAFDDTYAREAQERWGDTDPWRESRARTARYTKADWEQIKTEGEASTAAFVAAMEAGAPATSTEAMAAAELARQHIATWFYDLSPDMHRSLADMYVADPRFTRTYDDVRPGLAAYVRDAIHANADRRAAAG